MSSVDPRLASAIGGDRAAVAALLTELLPRVRNVVRYFLRTDDIDDTVQDSLIAIMRGLPTYRGEGKLTSWSDRVVARVAIEASRKRRADAKRHGEEVEVADARGTDEYLARRRLVLALDTLSDEMRRALVLHHVLEMTVPEIAEMLEVPDETVRSRLRNGREALRERMERKGEP
jgi:RNA polymerase sigma-70 factor (ECF subfamily)